MSQPPGAPGRPQARSDVCSPEGSPAPTSPLPGSCSPPGVGTWDPSPPTPAPPRAPGGLRCPRERVLAQCHLNITLVLPATGEAWPGPGHASGSQKQGEKNPARLRAGRSRAGFPGCCWGTHGGGVPPNGHCRAPVASAPRTAAPATWPWRGWQALRGGPGLLPASPGHPVGPGVRADRAQSRRHSSADTCVPWGPLETGGVRETPSPARVFVGEGLPPCLSLSLAAGGDLHTAH